MHQLAAFIVSARYWHRQRGGAALDFYGTISHGFMLHGVEGVMPNLESLWAADARAGAAWALVFPSDDWNQRLALHTLISEMAAGGSAPEGTIMQPSGCLYWETLPGNPACQRMWLRCAEPECTARFASQYYLDINNAVAEAQAARWRRSSTRTWN